MDDKPWAVGSGETDAKRTQAMVKAAMGAMTVCLGEDGGF